MHQRIHGRGGNSSFSGSFHASRLAMVDEKQYEQIMEKPREERSYLEFYTNFNIEEPLRIIYSKEDQVSTGASVTDAANSTETHKLCEELNRENEIDKDYDKCLGTKITKKEKQVFDSDISLCNISKQDKKIGAKDEESKNTGNPCIEESSKFSFRNIQPFEKETRYTGRSMMGYGYEEAGIWSRPSDTYIRFVEESRETLANKVEYDMDEQDDFWLEQYNSKRLKSEGDTISHEFFEIVLTKIEKEWIELDKKIPKDKSKENLSPDDSKCSICDDGECENVNAIVFCDGCNLAVHQDCYGIPYIPEGQWLCRKCLISPQSTLNCIFCPNTTGAFKQTSDNRWAHLLCAIWIPEVTVMNTVYQEPIDNIHKIPASRWKLICYICQQRMGASIQCVNKSCYRAFHVTCARRARLYMPMKKNSTELKAYCDKHVPSFWRNEHNIMKFLHETRKHFLSYTPSTSQFVENNHNSNHIHGSSSRIYINLKKTRTYPLIPVYIQNRLLDYIHKFPIRKKSVFITDICKYWSLKKESRKNASLIKRLQLKTENEIHNLSTDQITERIEFAKILKQDLEKLLELTDSVKKREEEKKKISCYLETVADTVYFPITHIIKYILNCIERWDKNKLFSNVPIDTFNYNPINGMPVSLSMISEKIEDREYANLLQFKTDLMHVFDNAIKYNDNNTIYYKTAVRFKRQCEKLFLDAENISFLKMENERMVSDWSIFEPKGLSIKEYAQVWPGDDIRTMSPLSEITDEEFNLLERHVNKIQKKDNLNKQNMENDIEKKNTHNLRSRSQRSK
ncbi:hypothetical protein T552_01734 [Pneumocystis carinii B80]|uniref:Uncharacterized protein n=1 Tax=Pneumocystis carinii (strain B80) TaxID=1408658 RepID=A0A0W4ZJD9_PNEC8|nr:hypothetical protein T552_01734 [Pneumocystis carinii B80]KTW28474.1 hypothetical protein T552_01734 [Pneumocystis carinii B80]